MELKVSIEFLPTDNANELVEMLDNALCTLRRHFCFNGSKSNLLRLRELMLKSGENPIAAKDAGTCGWWASVTVSQDEGYNGQGAKCKKG